MKFPEQFRKKENVLLFVILFVAFILRIYKLTFESLWLDELNTMIESAPSYGLHRLSQALGSFDPHPPLFFLCERVVFTLFGESDFTARLFPVLLGVTSVWAMYLLGKELLNKNLGLIAAAFTCVNYYNIYYSREARGYILVFATAVFSFLFLIRLIKHLRTRDMWAYSFFALLTLYSHYYGMFLVISQFVVALIFLFSEKDKKSYLTRFVVSGLIIAIGYAPWVPHMRKIAAMKSFWITGVSQEFLTDYFNTYFGGFNLMVPILVFLLLFYVVNVFGAGNNRGKLTDARTSPLTLSFVVFSISIAVTNTIPYVKSLVSMPMLFDRYTIVVLPVYLAAAAYGLELVGDKMVKGIILWVFVGWSLVFVTLVYGVYHKTHKMQFREMTEFMAADPQDRQYPVVNNVSLWHEGYYLDKFGFTGARLMGPRTETIDSMIHGISPVYRTRAFWLINAQGGSTPANYLEPGTKKLLDSAFWVDKEGAWQDTWAQLYIRKGDSDCIVSPANFPPNTGFDYNGEKVVAIWGGAVTSDPLHLAAGNYEMRILTTGTPAHAVFPHLVVSVNDKKIADFYTPEEFQEKHFTFTYTGKTDSARVKIDLDNDFADPQTHEDRNAFLKKIVFIKQ